MSEEVNVAELIQKVPLFENIKKGELKKLTDPKHLIFKRAQPGDAIVRQGELDTEFFVIVEGIASAYRTETGGETNLLGSYGAGDFFGEMSAISHQARSATVSADSPCTYMEIDATLFQSLFADKKSSFTTIIDSRYRERALAFHLNTAPIFKATSIEDLKKVAERAELVSYEKDDVIANQGEEADAVYLVRSGIIKRFVVEENGEERVQDYLCDNSSFGEISLTDDRAWTSNCVTMSRVDVVKIGRDLFTEVFSDTDNRTKLQARVDLLVAEERGIHTEISDDDHFELMVGNEAVKGTEALVIDLKKCTRCNLCVESCVSVHEDGVPRLSKRGFRDGDLMLSSACYNCKIPECMLSCKFGAIRRDVDGQIHIVVDNCVGCSKCESHCPYGVIRMAHLLTPAEQAAAQGSIWDTIPVVNKVYNWVKNSKKDEAVEEEVVAATKTKAKAIKCDLCAGLPFEACVYNCPCGAIGRRDPAALKGFGTLQM